MPSSKGPRTTNYEEKYNILKAQAHSDFQMCPTNDLQMLCSISDTLKRLFWSKETPHVFCLFLLFLVCRAADADVLFEIKGNVLTQE